MPIKGSKTLGRDQKFAGEDFLMNSVAKDLSLYVVISDLKYSYVLFSSVVFRPTGLSPFC